MEYEHDVALLSWQWDPLVGILLYTLHGHNAPLVGIISVPGTTEIITGDQAGNFKLWDRFPPICA